jgi:Zn-dependent protease
VAETSESEGVMPYLHLSWYVPFLLGCFFGVAAMALHESAHIATALALGLRIKKVGLNWKGLYTIRETRSANISLLVALAGPLINVALIASWRWLPNFGMANFCFALFNLLPISGSDGERALKCWTDMHGE